MKFNDRLVQLRKEKRLLQADMAKKIGVARATYGAYEQGTRQPDFETLQRIAKFFEVSTDFLLGNSVEGKQTIYGREVDTGELTENQRTVLEWAMQQEALSFHSKEELSKILDNLALIMEYEKSKSKSNGNTKS
jgi:transcriptional regulator with XRE-family HTH domain